VSYENDLYQWTKTQSDALRRRAVNEVDWDNVAEELESLGRSERREIVSRLEVLLLHLLKWRFQPDQRSQSWWASIRDARNELERVLEDNPSLRALPAERLPKAYANARVRTLEETGLYHLPEACEWTADQILSPKFLPEL
jgi:Domain of unknown function DUF29